MLLKQFCARMETQVFLVEDLLNDRNSFERILSDQLMEPIRGLFESLGVPGTTNNLTPRTTPNLATISANPKRPG
jgi:hypothetical protein